MEAARCFEFVELEQADPPTAALFRSSFGTPPPDLPFHFVARRRGDEATAAYVHYIEESPGIFLCGGLCVDTGLYRRLSPAERDVVKRHGSLSRWLLNESIGLLRGKLAVFAYTGNVMSRRDGVSSGFVPTADAHLIVQWHGAPPSARAGLVARIAALGPF